MPGDDRIVFGAVAMPEPDRKWLAAVERLPIESDWQGGHLLPPGPSGEAVTRLALMTAWTERVRVGTAILLLPLYHPIAVLAPEWRCPIRTWRRPVWSPFGRTAATGRLLTSS